MYECSLYKKVEGIESIPLVKMKKVKVKVFIL